MNPTTLYIDSYISYCGTCGRTANPYLPKHDNQPDGGKGCGVRWTHKFPKPKQPNSRLFTAIKNMRPDLIYGEGIPAAKPPVSTSGVTGYWRISPAPNKVEYERIEKYLTERNIVPQPRGQYVALAPRDLGNRRRFYAWFYALP